MIEHATATATSRVAVISPSGPPRFSAEPPSVALHRPGRPCMRSLPLAPDIRAWVSTSGRKPNPVTTALIWMHTGALLLVWDIAVLTGPALGHCVCPLSKDAELTARRWLDQVADNPGFLNTLTEAARITDEWRHATPPHIQAPYRTLHQ